MGVSTPAVQMLTRPRPSGGFTTMPEERPSWQLPSGYFIPAKMAMTMERVVFPRPDAETAAMAFHRNAYPGILYEIPICIQGGAYPFRFQLTGGPAGMSIGEVITDSHYGIVRWTPAATGNYSATVRVTDQEGASVDITWSINVNTDWVRFVSPSGNDSTGNGSLAAPWRTLAHAGGQVTGGRALCLRAGTHALTGGGQQLSASGYRSLFGYPGEMPRIDMGSCTGNGALWWIGTSDTFVSGIEFFQSPTVSTPRIFATLDAHSRIVQYNNMFDPNGGGALGDADNNSFLFLGAGASQRSYVAQVFNTFHKLHYINTNGWGNFDIYRTRYFLVEGNTYGTPAVDGTDSGVTWVKGANNEDGTIRRNRCANPWPGAIIELYMGLDGGEYPGPRNIEVCYNTLISRTDVRSVAISVGRASQTGQARTGIWSYRNTIRGDLVIHSRSWPLEFTSESDVIVSNASYSGQTHKVVMFDANAPANVWFNPANRTAITLSVLGTECHGNTSAGILDANYRLQATYRANWLGRRGAEIAGTATDLAKIYRYEDFRSLQPGGLLTSLPGFEASTAVYANDRTYNGHRVVRTTITAADEASGFGKFGFIHSIPNNLWLGNGDALWIRMPFFFASDFAMDTDHGSLKVWRVHTRSATGDNQGYIDLQINDEPNLDWRFIYEGDQNQTPPWVDPVTNGQGKVVKGQFDLWELAIGIGHVPQSEGGNAYLRFYKNGVLCGSITNRKTLVTATDRVDAIYMFTYWNGPIPKTQSVDIGPIAVALRCTGARDDTPHLAIDTQGNRFIGTAMST